MNYVIANIDVTNLSRSAQPFRNSFRAYIKANYVNSEFVPLDKRTSIKINLCNVTVFPANHYKISRISEFDLNIISHKRLSDHGIEPF